MFYLISVDTVLTQVQYSLFETSTESILWRGDYDIKDMVINKGIKIENMEISKAGEITIKQWYDETKIDENSDNIERYMIVCQVDVGVFRLVSKYNIVYKNKTDLESMIRDNQILNAKFNGDKLECKDIYNIIREVEFKKRIKSEYNKYIAKSRMLGHDISFEYKIENSEVKLKKYTGESEHVILPPFITTIMQEAFEYAHISSIQLNEGLKCIGNDAFGHCNLTKITIPSTVEFIGVDAFKRNNRLFDIDGNLNLDRVVLNSINTKVLR